MIEKIKNSPLNLQATSVYNFNEFSLTELLNKFFTSINECIDSSNQALNFLVWLKGEGLSQETITELNNMYNDGRLTSAIDTLSGNLNNKLNEVNAELNIKLGNANEELNIKLDNVNEEINNKLNETNTQLEQIKIQLTSYNKLEGETDDTNRINRMLSQGRGKNLYIPDGTYIISDSLIIYNDTTLTLSDKAEIKMKENTVIKENVNNWNGKHMIKNDLTLGVKNIIIEGGIWNGQGLTQAQDSHRGIRLEGVNGLVLRNLKIKEVNGWAICHVNCSNFHFYNIDITQQYSETLFNYDGITGTSTNGTIENIDCYSGDDAIALYSGNPLFETKKDIENVTIRNIRFKDNNNLSCYTGIALYSTYNTTMKNVIVENIQGNTRRYTVKIMNFNPEVGNGYFKNITLKNFNCNSKSTHPILIKDCYIDNLVIDGYNRKYLNEYSLDYGYFAYIFPNTYVDNITLNNINNIIEKEGVNQTLLRDEGITKRVNLNNINSYHSTQNTTTTVYHKAGVSTDVTEVNGSNIARIGKNLTNINVALNNTSKARIRGFDLISSLDNIVPEDGDYFTILNQGCATYSNGFWNVSQGYISVTNSQTIDKPYDVLSVDSSTTSITIELPNKLKTKGFKCYVRIPYYVNPIKFTNNEVQIFSDRMFSVGTFMIYSTGSNFMCVKLTDDIMNV